MKIGIIGNEACDADSMVSAIVYAKLKNMIDSKNEYIPFFQCDDIISRLDFMGACKEAGFIPDGSIETITPENVKNISKWILVDHHYPTTVFLKVVPDARDKVIEIIDHHSLVPDSNGNGLVQKIKNSVENRTIGSCTTLVAEKVLKGIQPLLKLLLCTIMIDTKNLTDGTKTTDDDRDILEKLKQLTQISHGDANEIFKRLLDSKYNPDFWEVAPIDKILGYDYKDSKSKNGFTFGMSSILTNINEYRKNLDVTAFCVNSSMLDGSKYLLMMNFDKRVFDKLANLANLANVKKCPFEFEFEFEMYHKEKGQKEDVEYSAAIFKITTDFSRKKFIPLLICILNELNI